MSFGPCPFSSLKCYHPSSASYCLTKVAVCPTGKVFSTQEVSVGKAAVTEVQYQLEGHLVLDEVGMSVGQPAAPPPSLVLWSGGLLRLLWRLLSSSALPSWRWVIFFFLRHSVCVYAFITSPCPSVRLWIRVIELLVLVEALVVADVIEAAVGAVLTAQHW